MLPDPSPKQRNYKPAIIALSVAINALVAVLFFLPGNAQENREGLQLLPMLNAMYNCFTFVFLSVSLYAIKRKDIRMHRGYIIAAFCTTALFLVTYVVYHYLTESTPYGGTGAIRYVYYFFLITHVALAVAIVPLALTTLARGLNMQTDKHRRIARWTMPLWLYVSATGVIVYLMISPYY